MFNWIDLNALQLLTSSVCVFAYKCENVGALTTRCGHIRSEYMINAIMRQQPKWIPNIFKCWQLIHLTVPSLSAAKELAIRSVLVAHFIHEFGFVVRKFRRKTIRLDLLRLKFGYWKVIKSKKSGFSFCESPSRWASSYGNNVIKILKSKTSIFSFFLFF